MCIDIFHKDSVLILCILANMYDKKSGIEPTEEMISLISMK